MPAFAYLDHNATSPIRPAALDAMVETLRAGGNPSSVHRAGRAARTRVDAARRQVAALVGALPSEIVGRLEALLHGIAAEISAASGCGVEVRRIRTGKPAMMDAKFQRAIEEAASDGADGKSIRMPSGAGHDAQVLATIMPAGMLFVPSIDGISHHWSENTDDADIARGAEVFVEACRRLLSS